MQADLWLKAATQQLHSAGIATARLDALILLEDYSGYDRGYLLAHPELMIDDDTARKLAIVLKKRSQHTPLAYLRGEAEFYGRAFMVGPGVLVPRPESEALIELLNELFSSFVAVGTVPPNGHCWRLADVGTGSGALGITAQLEQPGTCVTLLEIDDAAIEVAKTNVINLSTPLPVFKNDLLQGMVADFDILLCNLPYVPDDYLINTAATYEPELAIFGGSDGLDLYRKMFSQIKIVANKPLYILTEALPTSHTALSDIAKHAGYNLDRTVDFGQLFVLK